MRSGNVSLVLISSQDRSSQDRQRVSQDSVQTLPNSALTGQREEVFEASRQRGGGAPNTDLLTGEGCNSDAEPLFLFLSWLVGAKGSGP